MPYKGYSKSFVHLFKGGMGSETGGFRGRALIAAVANDEQSSSAKLLAMNANPAEMTLAVRMPPARYSVTIISRH